MKLTNTTCHKCGGEAKKSTGFINTLVDSRGIHEPKLHRGTTVSRVGPANRVKCLKCTNCGHSWIPATDNMEEEILFI